MRIIVMAALLGLVGACEESDPFGPDLGPTVGPQLDGVLLELEFPDDLSVGDSVPFRYPVFAVFYPLSPPALVSETLSLTIRE